MVKYTSYRGMIQPTKGGPMAVFTAAWPDNKWRDALTELCGTDKWELADGPISFVELHGVTADNTVHVLVGDLSMQTPAASFISRVKDLVTLTSGSFKMLKDDIARWIRIADGNKAAAKPTPTGKALVAVPSTPACNVDDFPVVYSLTK